MRKPPSVLTPVIHRGRDDHGQILIGTFRELPGVVCEAREIDVLWSELVTAAQNLRERLGWPEVVVRTPNVKGSHWTIQGSEPTTVRSFGYTPAVTIADREGVHVEGEEVDRVPA